MRLLAGTALLAAVLAVFGADQPEPRWAVLNHAARQEIVAKDYPKLRETLAELRGLLPGNPQILYNLAAADAHLGRSQLALAELQDLADSGVVYDLKSDADFSSLLESADFAAVLGLVERNRRPVASAAPVFTLAERDLLPEDLAYDSKRHRFLIGSVTGCKIIGANGEIFSKTDWPVMALRVDSRRRILWAATGWLPNCRQCSGADRDKSALFAYDLDTGALRKRIPLPGKGLLGDMTISRAGDLYLSEGIYGAVFRLKANAPELERLDAPGEFPSPQTPALSADERTLYVPDYMRGVALMDLRTRNVRWLTPAQGIVLSGIDGFYRYGKQFLAVQNGVTPPRLLLLSDDLTRQEILEANTPGLGVPTHGTLVGGDFYFISNTGWDAYDDDGNKKPNSAPVESQIRKIRLRKR